MSETQLTKINGIQREDERTGLGAKQCMGHKLGADPGQSVLDRPVEEERQDGRRACVAPTRPRTRHEEHDTADNPVRGVIKPHLKLKGNSAH